MSYVPMSFNAVLILDSQKLKQSSSNNMRFVVDEITKIPDDGVRSLILYGEVERGVIRTGMNVHLEILGQGFKVHRIRDGEKQLEEASAGQQVGVILKGLQNVRVQLGEVLVDAS